MWTLTNCTCDTCQALYRAQEEEREKRTSDSWGIWRMRGEDDEGEFEYDPERDQVPMPGGSKDDDVDNITAMWAPMRIVPTELTLRRKGRHATWRPTDQGAIPRAMWRQALDGQVFTRRIKQDSATVLVDVSGSMNLRDFEVHDIMKRYPAGTMAMYSGEPHSYIKEAKGELFVLAHNGRAVREIPYHAGGNTCDGPALRWLASQPAPRYWICDGVVTDHQDNQTYATSRDANIICRRAHIRRFNNLDALLHHKESHVLPALMRSA